MQFSNYSLQNEMINKQIILVDKEIAGRESWIYLAHLIQAKQFDEAKILALRLYCNNGDNPQVCINLMELFYKLNDYDNTIFFAKQAMLNGHNTGYAAKRLCIILNKAKRYSAIVNVCNAVLNIRYHFNCKTNKSEFYKRKERALSKIDDASERDIIFTDKDFDFMVNKIDTNLDNYHKSLLKNYGKSKIESINRSILEHYNTIIARDSEATLYMEGKSINKPFNSTTL